MSTQKTLTFALMDPPFETPRTTTALRLIDRAARRGYNVNVFAYEGAVMMPFSKQKKHANAVHGRDLEGEDHPLTREWIEAIMTEAKQKGGKIDWVNCGLCEDERGAGEHIEGVRRGTPGDLVAFANDSENTLVIATR